MRAELGVIYKKIDSYGSQKHRVLHLFCDTMEQPVIHETESVPACLLLHMPRKLAALETHECRLK
jgi:hypothetical protein